MIHAKITGMKYYVDYKHDADNSYRMKITLKSENGHLIYFIVNVIVEFNVEDNETLEVDNIDYRFFDDIILTADQLKVIAVAVFNNEQKLIDYVLLQERITTAFSDREHLIII